MRQPPTQRRGKNEAAQEKDHAARRDSRPRPDPLSHRCQQPLRRSAGRAANSPAPRRRKCWPRSPATGGPPRKNFRFWRPSSQSMCVFAPPHPRHDRGGRDLHRQAAERRRRRDLPGRRQASAAGPGRTRQVSAQTRCAARPLAFVAGDYPRNARTLRQTDPLAPPASQPTAAEPESPPSPVPPGAPASAARSHVLPPPAPHICPPRATASPPREVRAIQLPPVAAKESRSRRRSRSPLRQVEGESQSREPGPRCVRLHGIPVALQRRPGAMAPPSRRGSRCATLRSVKDPQ